MDMVTLSYTKTSQFCTASWMGAMRIGMEPNHPVQKLANFAQELASHQHRWSWLKKIGSQL